MTEYCNLVKEINLIPRTLLDFFCLLLQKLFLISCSIVKSTFNFSYVNKIWVQIVAYITLKIMFYLLLVCLIIFQKWSQHFQFSMFLFRTLTLYYQMGEDMYLSIELWQEWLDMITEAKRQCSFSWFSLRMFIFGPKSSCCEGVKQLHGDVLAESLLVRPQPKANPKPSDLWVSDPSNKSVSLLSSE